MDFSKTDEQLLLIENVREVMNRGNYDLYFKECDAASEFPELAAQDMVDAGFAALYIPEEYGGTPCDLLTLVYVMEEAHAMGWPSMTWPGHPLQVDTMLTYGTEEQKRKYLPDLLSGKKVGAFGLTEPEAGSDASNTQTEAVLEGDHYVLNGSKCFITNASEADVFVVTAMTDKSKGNKGITAFIVEKGFEGFSIGKHEKKMGIRGSATSDLIFEDCIVPVENMLGKEGKGFGVAMGTLEGGRVGVAAQGLGIAEGAIRETVKYTSERMQFGKRISQFQNTQFELANL